jgi:hypothetical protein
MGTFYQYGFVCLLPYNSPNLLNVKFPQTGKDSSKRGEIILCLSHGIPLTSA